MKDIEQSPSFWPGIQQGKLNQNNRDQIDLLCDAFGQNAHNLRVNLGKTNFGDLFSAFNIVPHGGRWPRLTVMASPDWS
jgi:hypothetical protein